MVAAGRGNFKASVLIHHAHTDPDWFVYGPTCALVEADRTRPGTAEHIASLPGVVLMSLDLPAALAVAQHDTWAGAHAHHAAQPTPDRPSGAFVATTEPDRWKGVRVIDLTP
ncbi:hypothetical protein [Streptomyces sp. TRM49041]|uniref:hypothetical protein n=1 Tax=Streptomyces sp. TRM49041 TaxID=2603216 RepID=UPI0037D9AE80